MSTTLLFWAGCALGVLLTWIAGAAVLLCLAGPRLFEDDDETEEFNG